MTIDHKPGPYVQQRICSRKYTKPEVAQFKLKSLMFRFSTLHVPGKLNGTADAFSRRPVQQNSMDKSNCKDRVDNALDQCEDILNGSLIASVSAINSWSKNTAITTEETPSVLTWDQLKPPVLHQKNILLTALKRMILSNVTEKEKWDTSGIDFFLHRESLSIVGKVVMLFDRPAIPKSIRKQVLDHLHAGHLGATNKDV